MNGIRLNFHLYGWLCVLLAAIFYGNFRNETLLAQYLSPFNYEALSNLLLPQLISHHLPSFLQTAFIGYLVFFLIKESQRKPLYVGLLTFISASFLECLQLTHILPGTFDLLDGMAILIASAVASLVSYHQLNTSQETTRTTNVFLVTPALLSACLISMGCYEGCEPDEYTCVEPIKLTWEDLRADVEPVYGNQTTLTSAGRIYVNGSYLFVIDKYRGVHIFDQSDKQNPTRIVFIPILGISTLSIQSDKIYANSFTDFLVINYQQALNGTFDQTHVSRQTDMFKPPAYSSFLPEDYALEGEIDDHEGFIVRESSNTEDLPNKGFIIGYVDADGNDVLYGEYTDSSDSSGD